MPENIGSFELSNAGAFVVRMKAQYRSDANDSFSSPVNLTDDFPVGQVKLVDPDAAGVPNNTEVRLLVHVGGGNDQTAPQIFTYKRGNNHTAKYRITGTTLAPNLTLTGRT
jgi:hypothetical protein